MNISESFTECLRLLSIPKQSFTKIHFLKKFAFMSEVNDFKKKSLFLYALYCILHKLDYEQASKAIQKSQLSEQNQMPQFSIAIGMLLKALLYTYTDKHKQGLNLIKQAVLLLKSQVAIKSQIKNNYKNLISVIVKNLNLKSHRKYFYQYFVQIYDEFARQISSNQNELNEDILSAIQGRIKYLRQNIHCLPITLNSPHSFQRNLLLKSLSTEMLHNSSTKNSQYMMCDIKQTNQKSKRQKSITNIKKMISQTKLRKQFTIFNSKQKKYQFNNIKQKSTSRRNNPYEINLYVEQQPKCEFM